MEISLREWLIIGGIIVIALILFDGWRRIRANRNRLRIDIDKTLSDIGETSHHNPELPNGGARVRSFGEAPLAEPKKAHLQSKAKRSPQPTQLKVSDTDRLDISITEPESETPEPQVLHESEIPMLSEINPAELQDGMIDAFDQAVEDKPSTRFSAVEEAVPEAELPPLAVESVNPEPETEPVFASDAEHLEWDPELESQFDSYDEPESPTEAKTFVQPEPEPEPEPAPEPKWEQEPKFQPPEDKTHLSAATPIAAQPSKADYSGLDPLFDDIPSDSFDDHALDQEINQPNLYLDLDLEQPIHQIMANKVATKDSGKGTSKNTSKDNSLPAAEKPRRRQVENPSFTLPLDEPEDDLLSDMGLSALDSESVQAAQPPFKPKELASNAPTSDVSKRSDSRATESQSASSVASKSAAAATARKALTDMPDPEEVLVITVVGRDRQKLPGEPLQNVVEACGMEFGDMSIYHRFEGDAAASSLQFSMANAVNPGTFDPDAMDELETPAVSFFMSMREPKDPMTAYECMLATAETLAKHLDGDLLDEDRSVMREQTKEHYRQRIRDFEMQSRRRKLGR